MDAGGSEGDYALCHGDVWALADDERPRAVATIGAPGVLVARSVLSASPLFRGWQQEIATVLRGGGDAASALSAWAERRASDEDVAATLYTSAMLADLGGQIFVRTIEVPESTPARALDNRPAPPFLSMPFDEAIESFLARRLISPDEFRALSDAARTRAFTATRLATDTLRQRALDGLLEALRSGGTLDDFAAALQSEELSLGVTPSSQGYLETVYRTNIQASYGAGRYRQITSAAVAAARPYVEYRTAGDSRVRPSHALLDGKVFAQDDPGWSRFAPPNGFNCRCSIVTRRELGDRRVTLASSLSPDAQPDSGFDSAPLVTL